MALPPRKQAFVDAYLVEPNATRAAVLAGYSKKTAKQQGSRLLSSVDVRAALEERNAKRAEKAHLSGEKVLADIDRLAKKAEEAGEYNAAIKGRELLGKHLALFTEKIEHSGGITLEELVLGSHGKAEK